MYMTVETSAPILGELNFHLDVQGDTSGSSPGLVDIKAKVAFWYKEHDVYAVQGDQAAWPKPPVDIDMKVAF